MASVLSAIASLAGKAKGAVLGENDPADSLTDEVSEWLNANWPTLRSAYIMYHMSCWEAFLFYAGETWIDWDANSKTFQPTVMADDWVPKPRINRFSPAIDEVSSNFAAIPEIEAVVKANLGGDVWAHGIAEVASALGQHFINSNGLKGDYKSQEDKAGAASQMFVLAGCVFTNVYPEKVGELEQVRQSPTAMFSVTCPVCDLYQEVEQPPPACPQCGNPKIMVESVERTRPVIGPDGKQVMDKVPKYTIRCAVGNPIYAFPRPGAVGMGDTPYMLWAERRTLDSMHFEHGLDLEADTENADGYSVSLENALNYFYTGFSSSTAKAKDSCLVLYFYVEPGKMKEFPDGVFAIYANQKVQSVQPWTDAFIEHPLTMGEYLNIPTLFFPRAIAFDLVPIQREYQGYESLIKLHGMTSAVEPVIIDENTVVSEITGRADKIIKWRSIGPDSKEPHRMHHGSLDNGIYAQRQSLRDEFENITGAVSVYKGEQPGSVTAASGLQLLKAQAEMMFSKPSTNWNNMWRESVRKGVKNMQHFLTAADIAEIVGPNCEQKISDFKECNLDTIIDFISTGQGLPRTRSERKAEMTELFDRGALDITDVNVKQKVYELFGDTGMMKKFNADATRARYENRNMQKGIPATVMPEIEDMEVHYALHSEQVKSLDFDKWDDAAKELLLKHTIETKNFLTMAAMAEKEMEPAKGKPSPPKKTNDTNSASPQPSQGGPPSA